MLERQREGIAEAKAAGKHKGRPVSIDAAQIRQLRAELGPAAIAKRLGIARSSVTARSDNITLPAAPAKVATRRIRAEYALSRHGPLLFRSVRALYLRCCLESCFPSRPVSAGSSRLETWALQMSQEVFAPGLPAQDRLAPPPDR